MGENGSKTIWDWLGLKTSGEIFEDNRAWPVLASAFRIVVVLLTCLTLWLLGEIFYALLHHDHEAVRNNGLILAAVFAGIFAGWRGVILSKQADIAEQGHITDRYIKAVEQLGAEKTQKIGNGDEKTVPNIEVRIGALYTLERIAQESLRDHIPIMETICAYIRENARLDNKNYDRVDAEMTRQRQRELIDRSKERGETVPSIEEIEDVTIYRAPREDIQIAVTILGRRGVGRVDYEAVRYRGEKEDPYRLDLRATLLARVDLCNAELGPVLLDGTNLAGAKLNDANLMGADLHSANLAQASLDEADLRWARMNWTKLSGARMRGANLTSAALFFADLTWTKLDGANLTNAGLHGVDFTRADLHGANLTGAWLNRANFTQTLIRFTDFSNVREFTQKQLESAFGVRSGFGKTILPAGLIYPGHWHKAANAKGDALEIRRAYSIANGVWLKSLPPED